MRINRSSSLMLSAAVALAIAAPASALGPGNDTKPGAQSDTVSGVPCNDQGDTIGLDGPTLLWPPNHKMEEIEVSMTDAEGGEVMFGTTSTHNEMTPDGEMNGSGNTAGDVDDIDADAAKGTGTATGTVSVRAERSGRGDGRTYTITLDGSAGGDPCSGDFTIFVPHDMRPSNRVQPDNG